MHTNSREETSGGMYVLLGAAFATAAFLFFDREKRDQAVDLINKLKERVDSLTDNLQKKAEDVMDKGKITLHDATEKIERSADQASERLTRSPRQPK